MREVGGPVDGIENPAVPRGRPVPGRRAELLAEHVVIRVAIRDQLAKGPLDCQVDLGHEVDDALLADGETAADRLELHATSEPYGFDGGREERRGLRAVVWGVRHMAGDCAGDGMRRPAAQGRDGYASARTSFFTIRTSIPPSGIRRSETSSMKLRMRKMPRPLDFSMFSGASGSAMLSGSKPSPSSRTAITSSLVS